MTSNSPELSAILPVAEDLQAIAETVSHLQRQTCCSRIELIITGPQHVLEKVNSDDYSQFAAFQSVPLNGSCSLGQAYAAGIREAHAPVIACCEDHAYPEPEWAEVLIAAHKREWTVVGPALRNGNPGNLTSWAAFMMGFGPWAVPCAAQQVTHLPWHNNSYKRDVLLEYGEKLSNLFEAETVLQWKLRDKGHKLYLEPQARIAHLNVAKFNAWIVFQHYAGQKFGAKRCENWSLARRMLYGAASFLIPVVRFSRLLKPVLERGKCQKPKLAVLAVVMFGLIADGLGQMRGYFFGTGRSVEKTAEFDLHRAKYL